MTDCKKMIAGKCFAECTNEGTPDCCHRCFLYDPDFNPRQCIKELMTYYEERATQSNCKIFFAKVVKLLGSEAERIVGTTEWRAYYLENINPRHVFRGANFWTKERTASIKEMIRRDLTIAQIAETLGQNYAATHQKIYHMRKRGEIA